MTNVDGVLIDRAVALVEGMTHEHRRAFLSLFDVRTLVVWFVVEETDRVFTGTIEGSIEDWRTFYGRTLVDSWLATFAVQTFEGAVWKKRGETKLQRYTRVTVQPTALGKVVRAVFVERGRCQP